MLSTYSQLNHLYINAAAAKRILSIPASRRISITATAAGATVEFTHKGETVTAEISAEQFQAEFIRFRRDGARECIARPAYRSNFGERFEVTGAKGDSYQVEAGPDHLACTCEDWHQHETVCKHGYAVLNLLGLTSFGQYQQARKVVQFHPRTEPQQIGGRLCVNGVGIE